ncbi:MAG: hypothetical protein KTR35_23460 [Gammaproteobacteria bacterium]|nr:hypothetical protein [Gammaproteobacteria bacterium]
MNKATWYAMALLMGTLLSPITAANGLDTQDQARALDAASSVPWPAAARVKPNHVLGVQTLSIELGESKKNRSARIAHVYQYNHVIEQSRMVSIDLVADTVLDQQTIDSLHLPLSNNEINHAIALLAKAETLLERMRHEQRNRGVTAFNTLDELEVKASIFSPMDADHICVTNRCALLSLFDSTNTVFTLEPIAILSTGVVTTLKRH